MSGGGGTQIQSTEIQPWEPAVPYLTDIMQQAENIYESPVGREYFPGSTVVPFAPQTQQMLDLTEARSFDLMDPSSIYQTATDAYTQAATGGMGTSYGGPNLGLGIGSTYMGREAPGLGSAYDLLSPQADYLSGVRENIGRDIMGNLATQFGTMGRTGTSPGATDAATRAFTQAYAPIAQSAAEAERERQLTAGGQALTRQYQAGQADIARQQQALEDQQRRLYGASQADIALGQEAREAALARRLSGAEGLPGMQTDIDARIASGMGMLGGVGTAYEDLARRNLQEQIDRYDWSQQNALQRLNAYQALINPMGGFGQVGQKFQPSADPLTSAATGAGLGGMLFPAMGGTPWGAIGGALLGGLL